MYILGINAYHGDSSACLVKDGELIAAIEEERIRRVKHWAGFPAEAIRWCLAYASVDIQNVDVLAISRDPFARLHKKILRLVMRPPGWSFLGERARNLKKVRGARMRCAELFGVPEAELKARLVHVEHHRAHLASAFLVSPYEDAALVSVDGFGDFSSTTIGIGRGNTMRITERVEFPHSLGIFYTALTQFLGFWNYGDEYKVMGLSAFGAPAYRDALKKAVRVTPGGLFRLDTSYFLHDQGGVEMTWLDDAPKIGQLFSDKLGTLLGKPREPNTELTLRDKDIAASVQTVYEEIFFHILRRAAERTGMRRLALAGGCAQNSLANGKIFKETPFTDAYIPPAAHDGGTAVGAAFEAYHRITGAPKRFVMRHAYWGPSYDDAEIKKTLDDASIICEPQDQDSLIKKTAAALRDGKIVGWFHGRTEWGPRALGNRSILANPCRGDMKEILNTKIKKREPFRPFAPSVIEEVVGEYFEEAHPVPFMEKVYMIKPEKRSRIPAVVHADGTGRLQTVSKNENLLYYELIKAFGELTGVPILLNTSFNENEPIVNHPQEAIDCFLRTKMDLLVIGGYLVTRTN